jgi:hypothetical protein
MTRAVPVTLAGSLERAPRLVKSWPNLGETEDGRELELA